MDGPTICVDIEKERSKHTIMGKTILLCPPLAAFSSELHKKSDNMILIRRVNFKSPVISNSFSLKFLMLTERSTNAETVTSPFSKPSSGVD